MILPFSTQLNGKPTYFVEKIHSGLLQNDLMNGFDLGYNYNFNLDMLVACEPKIHTIREDKNNRWKVGTEIHFYINTRQKNMFQFAPVLTVVRVQNIEIIYVPFEGKKQDARPFVRVDGRLIYDVGQTLYSQMNEFAQNDGFDSINEFFEYFNKDFTGKLIHWTNCKY